MVTNTVLSPKDIIEPENMTPDMRMVTLTNGETKFIYTNEEYQLLITEGLIDVR